MKLVKHVSGVCVLSNSCVGVDISTSRVTVAEDGTHALLRQASKARQRVCVLSNSCVCIQVLATVVCAYMSSATAADMLY